MAPSERFPAGSGLQPGRIVAGRYRIEGPLGAGGMGAVYRAWDSQRKAPVALKLLTRAMDPEDLLRFRREAELAARAAQGSGGVVRVHDLGSEGQLPYLAMELVEGRDLSALIREGSLAPEQAAALVERIAQTLAACHRAGIVHRDLKPQNVLVPAASPDRPLLADFGLARAQGGESLTRTGDVMGTPAYMAPEQARGEARDDPRIDVWALGAVLYEALTGEPPYRGTPAQVLYQLAEGDPVPPRQRRPGIPAALEAVVQRALSRDPARRYRDAGELAEALADVRLGRARGSRLVAPALLLGVVLVGGGTWVGLRWEPAGPAAAATPGPGGDPRQRAALWLARLEQLPAGELPAELRRRAGAEPGLERSESEWLLKLERTLGPLDPRAASCADELDRLAASSPPGWDGARAVARRLSARYRQELTRLAPDLEAEPEPGPALARWSGHGWAAQAIRLAPDLEAELLTLKQQALEDQAPAWRRGLARAAERALALPLRDPGVLDAALAPLRDFAAAAPALRAGPRLAEVLHETLRSLLGQLDEHEAAQAWRALAILRYERVRFYALDPVRREEAGLSRAVRMTAIQAETDPARLLAMLRVPERQWLPESIELRVSAEQLAALRQELPESRAVALIALARGRKELRLGQGGSLGEILDAAALLLDPARGLDDLSQAGRSAGVRAAGHVVLEAWRRPPADGPWTRAALEPLLELARAATSEVRALGVATEELSADDLRDAATLEVELEQERGWSAPQASLDRLAAISRLLEERARRAREERSVLQAGIEAARRELRLFLATCYHQVGRPAEACEEALAVWDEQRQIGRPHPTAAQTLGELLLQARRSEQALVLAGQLEEIAGGRDLSMAELVVRILLSCGQRERAAERLRQALQRWPGDASLLAHARELGLR